MEKQPGRNNIFRIVLAIVFICFGVVALGNNIGWWDIDDLFLDWWPLILVLLGFITIFAPGGSWPGGVFLVFVGILFLLHTHGVYDISDLIWPAMLVMVGVMVWPRKRRNSAPCGDGTVHETGEEHVFNINTLFHAQHELINDKQLSGGHATAVFGNLELDLRQSDPRENAYFEASAIFGSIRIFVPANWNITRAGGPVFGKVEDKRLKSADASFMRSVTFEMNAIFGHVEISN
ncbi:MAG: hypothetical protein JXR21_03255 [Candidatus Marinimicrobia bacterium]|nr:hypothetical protein [Candidatus Neomarinimicrobiota bacterium]